MAPAPRGAPPAREAIGVGSAMSTIERLRRRPDFLAAADGRRFHTERLTGQGRLREAGAEAAPAAAGLRIGFTITKRVGHATERNRIRRRLRAAVAAVAAELPVLPADIVLIARRPAIDASFDTLKDDLRRAVGAVARPRGPDAAPRRGNGKGKGAGRGRARGGGPEAGSAPGDAAAGRFGPGTPGGHQDRPTPTRRDAGPPAAPSSLQNACGGVPDGQ